MACPNLSARWLSRTIDAVFAPRCVACRQPLGVNPVGPVCEACWVSIQMVSPPWCTQCGNPLRTFAASSQRCERCRHHPPRFDQARALGIYAGPLRHIVHALKYHGHQSLGLPLGTLLRQQRHALLESADVVVPVPLHPWRQMRRGFNQAETLARALNRPVWKPLRRCRLGVRQADLRGAARFANVEGAYAVRPWARRGTPPRRVVLIDDVMTTGATLDACSLALRDAGVEWVGALTVARTVALSEPGPEAVRPPQRPHAHRPSPPRR